MNVKTKSIYRMIRQKLKLEKQNMNELNWTRFFNFWNVEKLSRHNDCCGTFLRVCIWIMDGQWLDQSLFPAPLLHDIFSRNLILIRYIILDVIKSVWQQFRTPYYWFMEFCAFRMFFIGLIIYMASKEESIGVLQL